MKVFYDKQILRKSFTLGHKLLLYNSRMHLFRGNLHSRWSRLFTIYPQGAVEIENPTNSDAF